MEFEVVQEVVKIKQVLADTEYKAERIASPQDAYNIISKEIADEDREVFFVVCLNTKNEVNAIHRCHVGSLNASIVNPREVFKSAILNNSMSIVIGHNHPSYHVLNIVS